jgi:hypothetical protein
VRVDYDEKTDTARIHLMGGERRVVRREEVDKKELPGSVTLGFDPQASYGLPDGFLSRFANRSANPTS